MSNTLVIYIPGYKPNQHIFNVVKGSSLSLKYDLKKVTYSFKSTSDIIKLTKKIETEIKIKIKKGNWKKIILIGYSLGAAISVEISSRNPEFFSKLILISVFNDRKSLLKERGILIKDQENLSPIKKISKIKTPIVFIHGVDDISIRPELSIKVFKKANQPSSFIKLNSDHYFKKENQSEQLNDQLLFQLQ